MTSAANNSTVHSLELLCVPLATRYAAIISFLKAATTVSHCVSGGSPFSGASASEPN